MLMLLLLGGLFGTIQGSNGTWYQGCYNASDSDDQSTNASTVYSDVAGCAQYCQSRSLQSKEGSRKVMAVVVKGEGLVSIRAVDDTSAVYETTLSVAHFVSLTDSRFLLLRGQRSSDFVKKLNGLMKAYDLQLECRDESFDSRPQSSSTPKKEYKCEYTFREQIEMMRHLHTDAGLDDNVPLSRKAKPWREAVMRSMAVPMNEKAYFGGKFKEAIAVSCLSRRCWRLVQNVIDQVGQRMPEVINTALFKEVCGYRDESQLFTLLKGLADGDITRADFNRRLKQDKVEKELDSFSQGTPNKELKLLRAEVQKLKKENEELKKKLTAATQEHAPPPIPVYVPQPGPSHVPDMPLISLPKKRDRKRSIYTFADSDSSVQDDSFMDPDYPQTKRGCDGDMSDSSFSSEEFKMESFERLDEGFLQEKPAKKAKFNFVQAVKDLVQPEKEKTVKTVKVQRQETAMVENQESVEEEKTEKRQIRKRVMSSYVVGEDVMAVWRNTSPAWSEWYPAVVTAAVAGMYKVTYKEDGQQRFVKAVDIRKI